MRLRTGSGSSRLGGGKRIDQGAQLFGKPLENRRGWRIPRQERRVKHGKDYMEISS